MLRFTVVLFFLTLAWTVSAENSQQLTSAAAAGRIYQVEGLLAQGADVNATNSAGRPALVMTAYNGNQRTLALLLGAGADVNAVDGQGNMGIGVSLGGPDRYFGAGFTGRLASDPPGEGFLYLWMDMPSISHCQAKVAVGSDADVEQAEAELMDFARVIERYSNKIQLVRTLAVLAIARQRLGKRGEALRALERAVTMARKGNLFLPFVELGTSMVELLRQLPSESRFATRVERLVDTFGKPQARSAREAEVENSQIQQAAAIGNLEGLTNRELDVLELLSRRLQNKEIAARLGISSHTVNSHLKQLYQKLGVHGRREAVEQAVAVGVLERNPLD